MFKNLGLFMTVRHISWQHQATSKGWWALKWLLMEFASHLGKKLFLPGLLDAMLYEPTEKWLLNLPKDEMVLQDSCFMSLPDILQDTEENYWQTTNIGRTVFEISYFMEKSAGYYGPVGSRWMPQWYRKTSGDCPGSEMSLSILEFWKLLTMHFLLA